MSFFGDLGRALPKQEEPAFGTTLMPFTPKNSGIFTSGMNILRKKQVDDNNAEYNRRQAALPKPPPVATPEQIQQLQAANPYANLFTPAKTSAGVASVNSVLFPSTSSVSIGG